MKFLIISVVVVIFLTNIRCELYYDLVHEQFNSFKLEYDKKYSSETEENYRFKIFINNMQIILKHNQRYELGMISYKMGINQFTDMFSHEVKFERNGINSTLLNTIEYNENAITYLSPLNIVVPNNTNWIEKGAVTGVKNQGQCGSCWAFSTTGAIEGQYFRAANNLVSLSEQNLLDCSGKYGNNGCDGGWMDYAYKYVIQYGIDTENSYPYHARESSCKFNTKNIGAKIKSFVSLPNGNEQKLMEAVSSIGPISVAIDASQNSFQMYSEGIYYDPECSSRDLDHAVLVVGYGTERSGGDYWLVKNSWGTTWGDRGYIKMARNKRNNCGIASHATYPLL